MRMDVSLLIQAMAASALKPEKALFLFPLDGRGRKPEMLLANGFFGVAYLAAQIVDGLLALVCRQAGKLLLHAVHVKQARASVALP